MDFSGGTVDKNPPASAGECEFDPQPVKIPHAAEQLNRVPQLLSLCAATTEAQEPRACAQQREIPATRSPCTTTKGPCMWQLEKAHGQQQKPRAIEIIE